MRVGLAQINSHLGDFSGNRKKIINKILRAKDRRCDLVVFPELSLFGYHPGDLLERPSIVDRQLAELDKLQQEVPEGVVAIVGVVTKNLKNSGRPYMNSAILIEHNKKPKFFAKELHPTYDVFDDHRHFAKGDISKNIFRYKKQKILVTICEDLWGWKELGNYESNPLKAVAKRNDKEEKIDLVLNLSASPYTENKKQQRELVVEKTARLFKAPVCYVNMVGGQDELIFDGGSFSVNKKGQKIAQSVRFSEELNIVDLEKNEGDVRQDVGKTLAENRRALVLGIRDYVEKCGFTKVHLGLSGGIDSALVAVLAVDALGPQNVVGIGLPGPFNADESLQLAEKLSENLGCEFIKMDINKPYQSLVNTLDGVFTDFQFGLTHENVQARLRGLLLMAYGNQQNSMLLTTGNKSEYATGYTTLYGDMCGGLAPIADLVKGAVFAMSKLYNEQYELIPQRIIDRPPSAELRPNQKDSDSLPDYAQLDKTVTKIVEKKGRARGTEEKWMLSALMRSEFKRWQAPPILKVTDHAFGRGRRLPIAHKAIF